MTPQARLRRIRHWLVFFIIGLVLSGVTAFPLVTELRNLWVIHWGMPCRVAVVPLALIAAPTRGLPWWWIPIDISFGLFGILPLLIVRRHILALAATGATPAAAVPTPAPVSA